MNTPTPRPNIILFLPDQLRHDFLACYGADFVATPNIDRLAQTGVRYTRAYSTHPICVPARCALLTGMHGVKTGVLDNGTFLRPDYRDLGINTWPELFEANGIRTVAIGKMHFYPWDADFGFGERVIAEDKLWGFIEDDYHDFLAEAGLNKRQFVDEPEYHSGFQAYTNPFPAHLSVDRFVGAKAADWIDQHAGEGPFAMMIGFPSPHDPYDPPAEYARHTPQDMPAPLPGVAADNAFMHSPEPWAGTRKPWYALNHDRNPVLEDFLRQRAYYAGLVEQIDSEIGNVVAALKRNGLNATTLLILASDHGDYLGDHSLRGKGSFFESATHIPLIVSGCDTPHEVRDDLVTLTDVTATLIRAADCEQPAGMDCDVLPGLGFGQPDQREVIVGALRRGWMAIDGTWKLCKYPGGSHLFNLETDPAEQNNLSSVAANAPQRERLDRLITAEMMRLVEEGSQDRRVYDFTLSGSAEFGRTGWRRPYPRRWNAVD